MRPAAGGEVAGAVRGVLLEVAPASDEKKTAVVGRGGGCAAPCVAWSKVDAAGCGDLERKTTTGPKAGGEVAGAVLGVLLEVAPASDGKKAPGTAAEGAACGRPALSPWKERM